MMNRLVVSMIGDQFPHCWNQTAIVRLCKVGRNQRFVDGGRVFQMRTDGTLTAYNAQTGEQLWSKPEFAGG